MQAQRLELKQVEGVEEAAQRRSDVVRMGRQDKTNVFGVIIDDLLVQGLHEMQPHLCAIGGLASKRARSGEGCPVLVDKCFERRRRPTTNRLDQVVLAGENPALVVERGLAT